MCFDREESLNRQCVFSIVDMKCESGLALPRLIENDILDGPIAVQKRLVRNRCLHRRNVAKVIEGGLSE